MIDLDYAVPASSRQPRSWLALVMSVLMIVAMFVPAKEPTITIEHHQDQGGWICIINQDSDTLLSGYYDKDPARECTWPMK